MDEKASQPCDFFFLFRSFFFLKSSISRNFTEFQNLLPTTLPKQPQNTPLPAAPLPPPSFKDIKIIMI